MQNNQRCIADLLATLSNKAFAQLTSTLVAGRPPARRGCSSLTIDSRGNGRKEGRKTSAKGKDEKMALLASVVRGCGTILDCRSVFVIAKRVYERICSRHMLRTKTRGIIVPNYGEHNVQSRKRLINLRSITFSFSSPPFPPSHYTTNTPRAPTPSIRCSMQQYACNVRLNYRFSCKVASTMRPAC